MSEDHEQMGVSPAITAVRFPLFSPIEKPSDGTRPAGTYEEPVQLHAIKGRYTTIFIFVSSLGGFKTWHSKRTKTFIKKEWLVHNY